MSSDETHESVTWKATLTCWLSHPNTPIIAGVLFVGALAVFGLNKSGYRLSALTGRPNIVVFDPVRFANSQRATASLLASMPSANLSFTLTQVAKQAEAVILEEAHGSVVLVKQAVVVPVGLEDITDAVLNRFGLPTNVPTVTIRPGESAVDVAPTDSMFSTGKLREDYRLELQRRSGALVEEDNKRDAQTRMVP